MFVNRCWAVASLALAAPFLASVPASAQETPGVNVNAQCAQAYEQAQEQRKSGQLIAARGTLQQCAVDQCPDFIRTDCANWFGEVQNDIPTLVFAVRSRGKDLVDVRITLGDREITSRIDGKAVELDPGQYDLEFQADGLQPLTQHFVVATGERNRLVQVELTPVAGASDVASLPAKPQARTWLVPGVLAGVGVVGVGAFAGLGAWGKSGENELKRECSPHCSHDRVSSVKTKFLLADVSLGVGVASLALGAYFFFSQGKEPARASAPNVGVFASANATMVTYRGRF